MTWSKTKSTPLVMGGNPIKLFFKGSKYNKSRMRYPEHEITGQHKEIR